MKKSSTPIYICFLIALLVTIAGVFLAFLLIWLEKLAFSAKDFIIGGTILFGTSYGIAYFIIRAYIQSKLEQVYKAIHRYHQGLNNSEGKLAMSKDVFGQMNADVNQWMKDVEERVKVQTDLADYRRQFIGNLSHEIKSPIFNIQGYLDTLLDGAIHDENVNMSYLNQASRNLTRLVSIVDDLSTISKLEYNQVVIKMDDFDIVSLIGDVFDELALVADERNIELKLDSQNESYFRVKGDERAIRQVLVNLIINSIKYGQVNGHTTVNLLDMNTYVIVQVVDDGIGIEPKHVDHLCDRFYRVSQSRSILRGGTGLGLSIVKHILEAHGQNLVITSVLGEGSTFAFHLNK